MSRNANKFFADVLLTQKYLMFLKDETFILFCIKYSRNKL